MHATPEITSFLSSLAAKLPGMLMYRSSAQILCSGPFSQGRLQSVWVLGRFSQTQVYKGAAVFSKGAFLFAVCVWDKRPNAFQASVGTFAYAQRGCDGVSTQ